MEPSARVASLTPAPATADARMVRYESLFAMAERLTAAETVDQCAEAAEAHLKHVFNLVAWRVVIDRGTGFLVVDGSRAGTAIDELIELPAWDAARWALDRPLFQQRPDLVGPALPVPAHLTGKGVEGLLILPFQRTGQPRCMLLAASRRSEITHLDLKFAQMAGSLLCDQLGAVILRRQLIEALEDQAWHDGLTGIPNRRAIMATLHKELANAERHDEHMTVLLADVDHFKRINDTYGHQTGDDVLKETARRLTALTREGDSVGRYGGEEFLFVLHRCDLSGARYAGERIRSRFCASPLAVPNAGTADAIEVTMSIGAVSTQDHPGLRPEELIARADEALYLAKQTGRNRVGQRLATGVTVYSERRTGRPVAPDAPVT